MNIIASIPELLKIFSEVIVASKRGYKNLDLPKKFSKIREASVSILVLRGIIKYFFFFAFLLQQIDTLVKRLKRSIIKDQKSTHVIPVDLQKRSSKTREKFMRDSQLHMI